MKTYFLYATINGVASLRLCCKVKRYVETILYEEYEEYTFYQNELFNKTVRSNALGPIIYELDELLTLLLCDHIKYHWQKTKRYNQNL